MKSIQNISDLKSKKVFLRVDFNVPLEDGKIQDDFRIKKALPTINFLKEKGARIILASHLEADPPNSLRPVFEYLQKIYPSIRFVSEYLIEDGKTALGDLGEGEIALLENLRLNPGEKKNNDVFAQQLASLADMYVNDAFSASHRAHASIVGVPKYIPGYAGLQLEEEVKNLSKAFHPPKPFLFILGGAKFDTKMPLLTKFLSLADYVFVGGALANNFFKEQGLNIGVSLFSEGTFPIKEMLASGKIILPSDVTVKNGDTKSTKKVTEVVEGDYIGDVGPVTIQQLQRVVNQSKFVLWNGPLGNYEIGFTEKTAELAQIIAESGAESIVGGGDTLAAIASLGLEQKFTFISTAGGAMLDFLANETLPGIEVLKKA